MLTVQLVNLPKSVIEFAFQSEGKPWFGIGRISIPRQVPDELMAMICSSDPITQTIVLFGFAKHRPIRGQFLIC